MDSNSDSLNEGNLQDILSSSPANSSFMLPSMDGTPPKVVTMDEVKHVFKNLQNMTLAHEIALNPDFRLQPYEPPEQSLERRIRDMLHKAFWDILRKQLNETPPCYDYAIQLLADIKECFPQILTLQNKRALDYINEVLDAAVIKQQAERGLLDFRSYASFVLQVMAKSCAPIRDDSVKALSDITDVVDMFRGILETMTLMKLDMANYLLDLTRNDIMNHSVEYEKEKFKEYLEYYKMGFPATESWLMRNRVNNENGQPSNNSDTIYNAYMELLDWSKDNEFPEVLSMDKERILQLGVRAKRLCLATSLMSIAQAVPIISQRGENRIALAKQVEILLQDLQQDDKSIAETIESIYAQMRKFMNEALEKENDPLLTESVETQLQKQVLQIANENAPVRALMWKRLMVYVRFNLGTAVGDTPPQLTGYGDYREQVTSFMASFKRVILYNHSVFGDYFLELLNKMISAKKTADALDGNKDNAGPATSGTTDDGATKLM